MNIYYILRWSCSKNDWGFIRPARYEARSPNHAVSKVLSRVTGQLNRVKEVSLRSKPLRTECTFKVVTNKGESKYFIPASKDLRGLLEDYPDQVPTC